MFDILTNLAASPVQSSIIIFCTVIILYVRTMRHLIIVDDIKHYNDIKNGLFNNPGMKWLTRIQLRLYGGGTFAHKRVCGCDKKNKDVVCKICGGKGGYTHIDCSADHLFTTVLFGITCVLIYLALGRNIVSFTAAMLYAFNPANNQTSIWLNGRRYSVNIILTLLMLLLAPLGLLFYFATPMFQINAIFAPILLGGWWSLSIPVVLALGWKKFSEFYRERMEAIKNDDMRVFHVKRLIVIVKTFGFYVWKMTLPGRTQMVYPFIVEWGMTERGNEEAYRLDKYFTVGVLSLCAVAAGLALLDGQNRLYLLFILVSTLQFCNVITPTQTAADRYISMPNVFMMYMIAYIVHTFTGSYAIPIIIGLAVYYVQSLNITMNMYKSIYSFYEYHNYYQPDNVMLRKFRVNWLMKTNDVLGAWELIKIGLLYNPNDFTMCYQAAACMQMMGDSKMSNHYLDKAEANHYINQEPLWRKSISEMRKNNDAMASNKRVFKAMQPAGWKK